VSKKKKWYQNRAFLRQQREWYERLAEEGFEDIEYVSPQTGETSNLFREKKLQFSIIRYTAEYYRAAAQVALLRLMQEDEWDHVTVFALHADGVAGRETSEIIGRARATVREMLAPFIQEVKIYARDE